MRRRRGNIHINCAPVLGFTWLVRLVPAIFNTQSLVLLLQIGFFGAFVLVATRVVPAEARSSVSLVLVLAQAGLQLHVQHFCLGECQDKAGIPWIHGVPFSCTGPSAPPLGFHWPPGSPPSAPRSHPRLGRFQSRWGMDCPLSWALSELGD